MPALHYAESADGARIAYRTSGSGDPLVLVHGSVTSSGDWVFVLPLLRSRFTVVTMDRRGRSQSGDGPEYSMEREADDILAVLDAVGGELLVAHSYGALCSTVTAERTDRLRRLVLYEPPIAIQPGRVKGLDELLARGDLETAVERFLAAAGTPDDQLELIRNSPAWPVLVEAVPTLPREMRAGTSWRPPAERVDVPTLFLLGAETDAPVYLDGHDQVRAAFPNSRLELIPGQRHIAHVFAAEAFAELVGDFCGDLE